MKKIYLLFCVLISLNSFSQSAELGLKAGFHQANIDGDNATSYQTRLSPALAAFAKIYVSDKFSFQPELQYGPYGAKEVSQNGEYQYKLDQINVPLKFNFYTGRAGNEYGFKINLGPQVGFLIKDDIKYNGITADLSDLIKENDGDFSNIDLGAVLNFGYEFESFGLWLETGAYHSLSPIWEVGGDKNYNTVGTFTVGYNFAK